MTTALFRWLVVVPIVIAGAFLAWMLVAAPAGAAATEPAADGPNLYLVHCATCHGADGAGVTDRGPSLLHEGRASADFALRTGRMPLADSNVQPSRGPVRFDDTEIRALVDYVGEIGDGPDIPVIDPDSGSLADGARLFRLNCAACHVASGAGAAIGTGGIAPSLMDSTPTQVGEAVLIGPGAMPVFGAITGHDLGDAGGLRHGSPGGEHHGGDIARRRRPGRRGTGGMGDRPRRAIVGLRTVDRFAIRRRAGREPEGSST